MICPFVKAASGYKTLSRLETARLRLPTRKDSVLRGMFVLHGLLTNFHQIDDCALRLFLPGRLENILFTFPLLLDKLRQLLALDIPQRFAWKAFPGFSGDRRLVFAHDGF